MKKYYSPWPNSPSSTGEPRGAYQPSTGGSTQNDIPQTPVKHPFEKELEALINKHSMENDSDTPDFILAQYMFTCLSAYRIAVQARDKWFGVDMWAEDKKKKS